VKFRENYGSGPYFWTTFSKEKNVPILAKNGLGYILGDFSQTHLVTLFPSLASNTKEI
jgi:hypothetical protein